MKATSSHVHKMRYAHFPEKRVHVSIPRRGRFVQRATETDDSVWNIIVAVVLALLIFISLVILPTLLNWIFPT